MLCDVCTRRTTQIPYRTRVTIRSIKHASGRKSGVQAPVRRLYGLTVAQVGQKSLRHNTIAPRRRAATQPDPMPPPVHTAEYSGRQMTGWRPRSSENIVRRSTALLVFRSLGCRHWVGLPRKTYSAEYGLLVLRAPTAGGRVRGSAAFRTRHDSPRGAAGYRTRPKSHARYLWGGRTAEEAAEPHD